MTGHTLRVTDAECVALLRRLVSTPSVNPPGEECACAKILCEAFTANGIEARIDEFAPGRCNVVARLRGTGGAAALLLNGHLDTVPPGSQGWKRDPFSGDLDEGRLWGLGAVDMKGGVAGITLAAISLARAGVELRGDLIIALTAGEEVDSIGARRLVESGELADLDSIVIAEPTAFSIQVAEKGALWLEVVVEGRTAHGSRPDLGLNAIERAHHVIQRLLEYRFDAEPDAFLSPPTLSINTIVGGVKTNVIPDLCTLTVDIRTVSSQRHADIVEDLNKVIGSEGRITVLNDRPVVNTAVDASIVQVAHAAVTAVLGAEPAIRGQNAFTDASVFAALGVPQVILGPGHLEEAHCPNEGIGVEDFLKGIAVFEHLASKYLEPSRLE